MKNEYLVGGAVRDILLGITPSDRDYVVVGSSVEEMTVRFQNPIGVGFPVWLDRFDNEWALARSERSTGDRYTDFEFFTEGVTIEEDLFRRDFTINAMAYPLRLESKLSGIQENDIVDPWGGLKDLKDKKIRHVSDAFKEDPLRVLRAGRFLARYASRGFTIASSTLQLCRQMVRDGMLTSVPPERLWAETEKALSENQPVMYFKFLKEIGLCPELRIYDLLNLERLTESTRYKPLREKTIKRWAAVNGCGKLEIAFQTPKVYQRVTRNLTVLDASSGFINSPEYLVQILDEYGMYHNGEAVRWSLDIMRDEVAKIMFRKVLEGTKDLKVDVPQGPFYGEALLNKRKRIALKLV